jgi:hypothetical protein
LQRCLYAFECSWHSLFKPSAGRARLSYEVAENKSFLLCLFRYIQGLSRRGCPRTALEFCKLLVGLDPTDPLYVLTLVDNLALRAGEFNYLLTLPAAPELAARSLHLMPNIALSGALAKFRLEEAAGEEHDDRFLHPIHATDRSTSRLADAILRYPSVFKQLMGKAELSLVYQHTDLTANTFFSQPLYDSNVLQHLRRIFVDRSYGLWKAPELKAWLGRRS